MLHRPATPRAPRPEDLRRMLSEVEALRIEFKAKIDLKGQGKDARRDEFAKDILGLANTAGRTADDYAYLVIGAGDKFLPDGLRSYIPTAPNLYQQKQLLEIVNERCTPEIPELLYREIEVEGRRYGVIILPPSPHVHATARQLDTPKGPWRKNSIILRRGEGHVLASADDVRLMRHQKRRWNVVHRNYKIGGIEEVVERGWTSLQLAEALIALDYVIFEDLTPAKEGTKEQWAPIHWQYQNPGFWRQVQQG
jgi:hypothetical protein